MNKKTLIVLCIIFAVLVGLVFVKKNMKPQVSTTEEVADIISSPISLDGLSEIVIRLGDGAGGDKDNPRSVHLAKEAGQWIVKTQYGVRANEKAITPLLDKLDQLKGELRSNKKGLFEDYGIGDDQGVHVELRREGAEDTRVVVGTQKAGYQNNFVRLAGTNAVYLVGENILGTVGVRGENEEQKLDAGKWSDKRITDLKVDEVAGVAITQTIDGADQTVIDIRKNNVDGKKQWQSVNPYSFGLSASKVKDMMGTFNNTYARDIISAEDPEIFGAPNWTGTFTMESGDQVKLVRGAKDTNGENYYAKVEGAGYFYLVPVSTFDGREQGQGNIFAANPLKVEEDAVEGIDVKDIVNGKTFQVVKKAPEAVEGAAEAQDAKPEDVWTGADGTAVEKDTINGIITKLKDINLEAALQVSASPKTALTIKITGQGQTKEYTISEVNTLENGKECHFLRLGGEEQNYCVSKEQVSALQAALP